MCVVFFVSCKPDKVVNISYPNGDFYQLVLDETYVGAVIIKQMAITGNGGLYYKVVDFNGKWHEFYSYEIGANVRDTIVIDASKKLGYCKNDSLSVINFRHKILIKSNK